MKKLDIAVAGCGPGGLAAALFLHRAGHRVILFERFDVPRAIGSGLILQPSGLFVLELLGLADAAKAKGARIDRLFGRAAPSGRIVLDVRYADLPQCPAAFAIHRGTLFKLLFDAAMRDGIEIQTGKEIVRAEQGKEGCRRLHFARGQETGPFDLVVDALGTMSVLAGAPPSPLRFGALWATLDWCGSFDVHALEQVYRGARKMVGVLPIGRMPDEPGQKAAFFWSLRGCDHSAWLNAGLGPWKAEVRALWPETSPLLDQIVEPEQMAFARYAHRTLAQPVEPAMAHLGDAWHSTSPQLGQGANMALLDAAALAASMNGADSLDAALSSYVRQRRQHVRLYQALSWAFTPFYQSDGWALPWLRDHLIAPLSRIKPVPHLLVRTVSGMLIASGASDRRLLHLPLGEQTSKSRPR